MSCLVFSSKLQHIQNFIFIKTKLDSTKFKTNRNITLKTENYSHRVYTTVFHNWNNFSSWKHFSDSYNSGV